MAANYADTKAYTLTAAGSTMQDVMDALITHFGNAPGLWTSLANVGGQSLAIELKANPTCQIALRVLNNDCFVKVDPDRGLTAIGDESNPAQMSTNASPEAGSGTINAGNYSTRVLVIEHSEAITVLMSTPANSAIAWGIHAGLIYAPERPTDGALGLDGHGAMVGIMSSWFTSGNSVVRVYNSAGAAQWSYAQTDYFDNTNGPYYFSGGSADGLILSPKGVPLRALSGDNFNFVSVGKCQYLAYPPINNASFPLSKPFFKDDGPNGDESWLHISQNAGADCGNVVNWEHGKNV